MSGMKWQNKRLHKITEKIVLFLLVIMMVSIAVLQDANAVTITAKGMYLYNVSNTEQDGSSWTLSGENGSLSFSYKKIGAPDTAQLCAQCDYCNKPEWIDFQKQQAVWKHSLSGHPNQNNTFKVWYRQSRTSSYVFISTPSFMVVNGKVAFFSPAGQTEADFLKSLKKLDPNQFKGDPLYVDKKLLKQMKSTVKGIIRGKKTDEQKVKAIHDWIAKNIQYDHSGVGESPNSGPGNDINYVFRTRRAVCGGYAQMMNAFCSIANIPCVYVLGLAGTMEAGKKYTTTNHAWNVVYINKKWEFIDSCWDSSNKYYKDGDSRNVTQQPANYNYYKSKPFDIGKHRISMGVYYRFSVGGKYIAIRYKEADYIYRVVDHKKKTVQLASVVNGEKSVPLFGTVKIQDTDYKVVGISQKAFAKSPKTKEIRTFLWQLQSSKMKGALKGSKVQRVLIYGRYMTKEHQMLAKKPFEKNISGKKVNVKVTMNEFKW